MCRHLSKPAVSRKALFCFAVLSLLWMGPAAHAQQPPPLAPADDPVIVPDQVDQWESDIVKLALAAGRYLARLVGSEDANPHL